MSQAMILDMMKDLRFKSEPGEYACYGNIGFILLELITEKVNGMSYTDYVRENIAAKINADHTGTAWALHDGDLGDARALLLNGALPVEYPYEMAAGPGGIYSTAPDVADFGAAFFAGNEVLLSEDAIDRCSHVRAMPRRMRAMVWAGTLWSRSGMKRRTSKSAARAAICHICTHSCLLLPMSR